MMRLLHYFKDRYFFYLFALLIMGVFYFILYLYNALIDAIDYALILSSAILVFYFLVDFYKYNKKTKQIDYLLRLNDVSVVDLPKTCLLYTSGIKDVL